ncbi:MAG TPA: MFS transporter [Nitrospirae bacterium]|nr:tetracycline resistance protein, class B [bacterium BMS3Abin08]HDH06193.1 MFS transporter [Nitrospirota bacterium]HDZ61638.1 MFS transporter [Nitrospirota bacterium]
MKNRLGILLFCLFVVMIGYGLTLPVLAFYIERLALAEGATAQKAYIHVGLLTGVFALMQFFFAPLWGRWSDRIGRRPLFMIGLSGYAVFMALFGIGTNLFVLYAARILGGILSAAVLPTASAYVADLTSETERGKGMAWLGSAIGLGVVTGPALGAYLSRLDWHMEYRFGRFFVNDFSIPFFAAAILAVIALLATMRFLPESIRMPGREPHQKQSPNNSASHPDIGWKVIRKSFLDLLVLSFLGYFALSLFEGTFALHAQRMMNFGPSEMGLVFMVCGFIMAAAQAGVVGRFIGRVGEMPMLSLGFGLMGSALILLMTAQTMTFILFYVVLFALGMAALNPGLASLVSKRSGKHAGAALGLQSAANSLGQAAGPVVGSILFTWNIHLPYLLTAVPLIVTAIIMGRKYLAGKQGDSGLRSWISK